MKRNIGAVVAPAQDAAEFKITSVRLADGGATVALKFNSQTGTTYRVETSPSPGAGAWADAGVGAGGDGGEQGFDIPTTGLGGTHFFRVTAATATPTGFALIPGGVFTMGRTSGDTDPDAPPVSVTVSAFYMGKYEVTKALWDEVRTWALANGYAFDNPGDGKAADHPVHTVNWYDMVKWCNARSEREGLTPCYTVAGVPYRIGNSAPVCN